MAQKAGLQVTAHVMLGYPGETKEEMRATLDLVKELDFDFAQFYSTVPFPGSELYAQANNEGWITNRDWRFFEQNFCILKTPQLEPSEVEAFRSRAFREFYLRPKQIYKTIRSLKSLAAWNQALRALWGFRDWAG
jgi:anaerobic magnesium-protoporphyrin IX monomethyl ester cyclase